MSCPYRVKFELPDAPSWQRSERGAIRVRLAVGVRDFALKADAAVFEFFNQLFLFDRSGVDYPNLLPLLFGSLVVEQAFALSVPSASRQFSTMAHPPTIFSTTSVPFSVPS
jgi:hypothetical protein